jgi:hypothetical protein
VVRVHIRHEGWGAGVSAPIGPDMELTEVAVSLDSDRNTCAFDVHWFDPGFKIYSLEPGYDSFADFDFNWDDCDLKDSEVE